MDNSRPHITIEFLKNRIYIVRGAQVVLDQDLAIFYQTETKKINRAVNRNPERFTQNFCFYLTTEEYSRLDLIPQPEPSRRRKSNPPRAFTQMGVAMLSTVFRSPVAIQVSIDLMTLLATIPPQQEEPHNAVSTPSASNADIASSIRDLGSQLADISSSLRTITTHLTAQPAPLPQLPQPEKTSRPTRNSAQLAQADAICRTVAHHFEIPQEKLRSSTRTKDLVLAKQIAIYLMRELADLTFQEIGRILNKDHTTVLHAHRKFSDQLVTHSDLAETLKAIRDQLIS